MNNKQNNKYTIEDCRVFIESKGYCFYSINIITNEKLLWNNQILCSKQLHIPQTSISHCLLGVMKSTGNYRFEKQVDGT